MRGGRFVYLGSLRERRGGALGLGRVLRDGARTSRRLARAAAGARAAPRRRGQAAADGWSRRAPGMITAAAPPAEDPSPDEDGDRTTIEDGDCNDGDTNVNPGAVEVVITEPDPSGAVPEPADEDCDGVIDNAPPACDRNIAPADFDAIHGAHAIDLCAEGRRPGTGSGAC